MNKREHLVNAIALGAGIGYMMEPGADVETLRSVGELTVPVTLGTMIPDIDTAIGEHRKTFHNLPVLATFIVFPPLFGNLHYIWIGILTHYILDLLGTNRGMALFYPVKKEFEIPVGVPVNSILAPVVTAIVTVISLVISWIFLNQPDLQLVVRLREGFEFVRSLQFLR